MFMNGDDPLPLPNMQKFHPQDNILVVGRLVHVKQTCTHECRGIVSPGSLRLQVVRRRGGRKAGKHLRATSTRRRLSWALLTSLWKRKRAFYLKSRRSFFQCSLKNGAEPSPISRKGEKRCLHRCLTPLAMPPFRRHFALLCLRGSPLPRRGARDALARSPSP